MPTKEDHIKMIQDPDRWPRWPLLAMIDRKRHKAGVILQASDVPINRVYLLNIFQFNDNTNWKNVAHEDYSSVTELVEAGWAVD